MATMDPIRVPVEVELHWTTGDVSGGPYSSSTVVSGSVTGSGTSDFYNTGQWSVTNADFATLSEMIRLLKERMMTCMVCGDTHLETWGLCHVCIESVRLARSQLLKSMLEMIEE